MSEGSGEPQAVDGFWMQRITFEDGSQLELYASGEEKATARQWLWLLAAWIREHDGVPPTTLQRRPPEEEPVAVFDGHGLFPSFDCTDCGKPATAEKKLPNGEALPLCLDCMIARMKAS